MVKIIQKENVANADHQVNDDSNPGNVDSLPLPSHSSLQHAGHDWRHGRRDGGTLQGTAGEHGGGDGGNYALSEYKNITLLSIADFG